MSTNPSTHTWRKCTGEATVRVDAITVPRIGPFGCAKYDATGARIWTSSGYHNEPTAEQLAIWDAEAVTKAPELLAAAEAAAALQREQEGIVIARFPGVCAVTGTRFGRGARIKQTYLGWALAEVDINRDLNLGYQMDREDSNF